MHGTLEILSPYRRGVIAGSRKTGHIGDNPWSPQTTDGRQWARGYMLGTKRLRRQLGV